LKTALRHGWLQFLVNGPSAARDRRILALMLPHP
jgi:hypothetical protein